VTANVLLTGAFGNIGTNSLRELLRRGHRVRCFDVQTDANTRVAREFAGRIDVHWGDVRRLEDARAAVADCEVIIHLAAILPNAPAKQLQVAHEVNVGGTRTLLRAASQVARPPRFLLASSFSVFGHTQQRPPPRRASDPTQATSAYTEQKLACETAVRMADLDWLIFRFAHVPRLSLERAHAEMFDIPLNNRFEVLHAHDAGCAVANAVECERAWRRVLLVGGGSRCQVYFGDYLQRMLDAVGLGPLPAAAFSIHQYPTDWLDTEESQGLLAYQRHSLEDIIRDTMKRVGARRMVMPLVRPFVRASVLGLSPYWRASDRRNTKDSNRL
jgi:UDP-glucose 4-epimerase